MSVPQSCAGSLLLAGVQPLQVDQVGEVGEVCIARVDDGGASLENFPIKLDVLRQEDEGGEFWFNRRLQGRDTVHEPGLVCMNENLQSAAQSCAAQQQPTRISGAHPI